MKYPPPPKRSKKSAAADSMLSSRRASPSPINVPEEANSEQGSLAHVHTLGNDDYTYSDEVGGKARSFPGPLFARRSQLVPLGRKSPVYAESSAYADSSAYGDDDGMSQDLGGDEDSLFEDGETVMVMATPRGSWPGTLILIASDFSYISSSSTYFLCSPKAHPMLL